VAQLIVAFLLFALLMTSITIYGYRRYARPGRVYEQLGGESVLAPSPLVDFTAPVRQSPFVKVFELIGEKVPISPEDASTSRRYLIAAGYRSDASLAIYYGVKIVLCAVLLLFAVAFHSSVTSIRVLQIVFTVAATAAGYFGPNLVVEKLVDFRQERIRYSLPDALDLMVVCVEAGLGLDQAINNISRELAETHPDMAQEFNLVTLEMRAGKRRTDALRNLVDRTGEPDLRKLVGILLQTDRFGTSIGDALRSHSDFMRARRTQEAEERANKVGIKLIFPIFFFILPSMILVAAGPAIIQIFKVLRPLLRGVH
jgi:tight adherence protein C